MSFNTNDINHLPVITRTNYEEYFLLYIDDELTAAEKAAVENFAAANPDLQAELDLLLNTKLQAEEVYMAGKQSLLADSMLTTDLDEALLLYIDDELPANEKHIVAQKIQSDKTIQLHYQQLQKTKLDKSEAIVFPYKKELYRTEPSRRIVYMSLRVAAAILIIAGGALLFWQQSPGITTPPSVAHHTTEPIHQNNTDETTLITTLPEEDNTAAIAMQQDREDETGKHTMAPTMALVNKPTETVQQSKENNHPANNILAVLDDIDKIQDVAVKPIHVNEKPAKQIINNVPVTSAAPETYTITDAAMHSSDAGEDIAESDSRHKGSLKGFLRKATRFIERRTNIDPTDGDGELLIGAVAINLK